MGFASARSKLANLLIKAGYDKAKSLRAVKYPYVESIQLGHIKSDTERNDGITIKSVRTYEYAESEFGTTDQDGFSYVNDLEYNMLGLKRQAKCHLDITIPAENATDDDEENDSVAWKSPTLKARLKYRHPYPENTVIDSVKAMGFEQEGTASSSGEYGHQQGIIPLPQGGWLEVELI